MATAHRGLVRDAFAGKRAGSVAWRPALRSGDDMNWGTPFAALLLLPGALFLLLGGRSQTVTVRLFRALLLAALVAALADPVIPGTPAPAPLLVLADQSASFSMTDRARVWDAARAIAAGRPAATTVLAAVGRDARVVAGGDAPAVDPSGTDLGAALRMAAGWGGHTILLSDGGATNTDTDAAAEQLRKSGVIVDVVPMTSTVGLDVRVAAINLPTGIRDGQRFGGDVVVEATEATRSTLHLSVDGRERLMQTLDLKAGRTSIPFQSLPERIGVHTLRATLESSDAHPENNTLDQAIVIGPTPRVLVVERTPDSAAALRNALEQGGIQSEARRPKDLPTALQELQRFDAIVLNNVAATDLSREQQVAVREFVRTLGHGLLAIGGANSYGLGGYKETPIEEVLPVRMQPPPRRERQQVALLLIIDRSASMYGTDPSTSKIEMAKSGALAATQALVPDDRVGVMIFDTEVAYPVPFTTVGTGNALSSIQNRISEIQIGGGTDIYLALNTGLSDLAHQPVQVKHAVLLTDGQSYTQESYERLLDKARAAGITLSTIAIGEDADTKLLKHLAELGGGRYHYVSDPTLLPRLTLEETDIARSDPRVDGTIHAQVVGSHSTIRGLVPSAFPQLRGYVATTAKDGADVVLRSPSQDTLLATWQYGLGRAVAWTSDSGSDWAPGWQQWKDASVFWSQVVSYTFPDAAAGPVHIHVDERGGQPVLMVNANGADGAAIDLADVQGRVTRPDGSEQLVRFKQVAPGEYTSPFDHDQVGAYQIGVAVVKGDIVARTTGGYVRPYAAEFARAADIGLLTRIAQTTGGRIFADAATARQALLAPTGRPAVVLWPPLVALALLLWILEIGARRGLGLRRRRRSGER
ncbi:MAG: VWA domain-containing protein [Herpetosiphon sp.]